MFPLFLIKYHAPTAVAGCNSPRYPLYRKQAKLQSRSRWSRCCGKENNVLFLQEIEAPYLSRSAHSPAAIPTELFQLRNVQHFKFIL